MPGTKTASAGGVKRKRDPAKAQLREAKSKKRQKSPASTSADEGEGEDVQARILQLEAQILESRRHYNNIATLLQLATKTDDDVPVLAAVALCRVFSRLQAAGDMVKSKGMGDAEATVVAWLRERSIASFKLPERLEVRDELPRNAVGKVLKRTLRQGGAPG